MARCSYGVLLIALALMVSCARRPPSVTPVTPIDPGERLVPAPVNLDMRDGTFTFSPGTVIAAMHLEDVSDRPRQE